MRSARLIVAAAAVLVAAGCAQWEPSARDHHRAAGGHASGSVVSASLDDSGAASRPFRSSVSRIGADLRERMRWSWHEGCPVPLRDLRYLTVSYVNVRHHARVGELVVHKQVASDVVDVLRVLYRERFPIRRMRLVDDYRGSDARSMRHDNTSAFNCREVSDSPGTWSQHSYGRALDVNPVENPYVDADGDVQPRAGEPYADRSRRARGMIRPGGAVVRAFASIGWEWGGSWVGSKDYQHFSENGR